MERFTRISDIPEFYVTNRSFEQVCRLVNLSQQDILELPKNSSILEIGSGVFQKFARGMKDIRPDVTVFSLDPSLAIDTKNHSNFDTKSIKGENGDISTAIYINKGVFSSSIFSSQTRIEELRNLQELRIKEALKTGNVFAALAPNLPIKESSLDLIIDVYGPGYYIQVNQENEVERYFREIYRVLKHGGVIRIYPAVSTDLNLKRSSLDEDFSKEFSKIFYQKIFQKNNLNFEISFKEISDAESQENSNVMILKKL